MSIATIQEPKFIMKDIDLRKGSCQGSRTGRDCEGKDVIDKVVYVVSLL